MIRCVMVFVRNGKYHRIPDAEIEDRDEVRDGVDGDPQLIERIDGWRRTHTRFACQTGLYSVALPREE